MNTPASIHGGNGIINHRCEMTRSPERLCSACVNNRPRDTPSISFLTIVKNDVREFSLRQCVEKLGGRAFIPLIHTHVERAVQHKTKSTLRPAELSRRDAKIEDDAV